VSPDLSGAVTHLVPGPLRATEASALAASKIAVVIPEYLSRCVACHELLDPEPFTSPEVAVLRGLGKDDLVASPSGDPGEAGARWERLLTLRQLREALAARTTREAVAGLSWASRLPGTGLEPLWPSRASLPTATAKADPRLARAALSVLEPPWNSAASPARAPPPVPGPALPLSPATSGIRVGQFGEGDAEAWAAREALVRRSLTEGTGPPDVPEPADPPQSFVQKYHQASRLHHLSAGKLEAREYLLANPPCGPRPLSAKHSCPCLMHVDLDCFFVSASLQGLPEPERLRASAGPVFVCSSENLQSKAGAATVASCNYAARALGVRNGMWVRQARRLCPSAVVLPYDFRRYREASREFYDVIRTYSSRVMPVSVDEAYLDVTGLRRPLGRQRARSSGSREGPPPRSDLREFLPLAEAIRGELFAKAGLVASVGIGDSLLAARMATKLAKPNGVRILTRDTAKTDLRFKPVDFLPGAGPAVAELIRTNLGCETVGDLQRAPLSRMVEVLGIRRGQTFYEACRGEQADPFAGFVPTGGAASDPAGPGPGLLTDETEPPDGEMPAATPAQPLTKSVSVVVNYAIRPKGPEDVQRIVHDVIEEMALRMERRKCRATPGASLRLKFNVRHPEAPVEPLKYLGMGRCIAFSRSLRLHSGTPSERTRATEVLASAAGRMAGEMLREFESRDLRGLELTCDSVQSAYRDTEAHGCPDSSESNSQGAGSLPPAPEEALGKQDLSGRPAPQEPAVIWAPARLHRSWLTPALHEEGAAPAPALWQTRAFRRAAGGEKPERPQRPGRRTRETATSGVYKEVVHATAPEARLLATRALQLQCLQDGDLESCLDLGTPRGVVRLVVQRNYGLGGHHPQVRRPPPAG